MSDAIKPVAWFFVEDPWGANEWHWMTDSPESQDCDPRDWTPVYTKATLDAAIAAEREQYEARLRHQQASYEREIAIEVAAERERCVRVCENLQASMVEQGIASPSGDQFARAIRSGKD